ncbi:ring canal kelch isoform X2, partial [Aphis craccivora]
MKYQSVMENLMCELNDQEGVLSLIMCEQTKYTNSSYTVGVFEVLQSLRKDKFLCDINIETNVNTIIAAHKIVLISASPYFHKMFTNFSNINLNHIIISELDSTIIEILINYIYSGEIIVSKDNVKVLLAAANLLQLDYVKNICAEFLQTQLDPSNCIGIKAFADLYNCMELSTSCQTFIKNRFLEVTDKDEFLSLNSVDVINLISCNNIFVPQEENVFECVMNWVKHDLNSRKDFLPELMEHVRLPLISKHYFVNKVIDEPLLKCSPKCQFFINEASTFHLIKQVQPFKVLETIQCKPRKSIGFEKVFLLYSLQEKVGGLTYWDQTNLMSAPTTTNCYITGCLTVINDQFVLAMGGVNLRSSFQCVEMLDVTSPSPCWIPMMSMLVSRQDFGVGTLDNCVYAVSYTNIL